MATLLFKYFAALGHLFLCPYHHFSGTLAHNLVKQSERKWQVWHNPPIYLLDIPEPHPGSTCKRKYCIAVVTSQLTAYTLTFLFARIKHKKVLHLHIFLPQGQGHVIGKGITLRYILPFSVKYSYDGSWYSKARIFLHSSSNAAEVIGIWGNQNGRSFMFLCFTRVRIELQMFGSPFIEGQPKWLLDPFKLSVQSYRDQSWVAPWQPQWSKVCDTVLNFLFKTDTCPMFISFRLLKVVLHMKSNWQVSFGRSVL